MSNPTIQFRLDPYHIARGLQLLRRLDPHFKPTSISTIVKILYIDYCAKMTVNTKDSIEPEIWKEVHILCQEKGMPPSDPTLQEILALAKSRENKPIESTPTIPAIPQSDSEKSVVTDFSPPNLDNIPDWDIVDENNGEGDPK